ncbi:MAG: hypothetical protein N4A72_14230, partial [Bacteroidales bacterium]|nr:hypothetical protein [Bacteroidales bacterium]
MPRIIKANQEDKYPEYNLITYKLNNTMRKALYVILTALLLVHNITGIKAQGYPVQATLNIGLPHSPLLEDYYSGANPLFNLNVLYKDFNSTR